LFDASLGPSFAERSFSIYSTVSLKASRLVNQLVMYVLFGTLSVEA
jgi:hypothetical protein